MSKIEKIRAEIERRYKEYCITEIRAWEEKDKGNALFSQGQKMLCIELLSFLDTLEEPVCNYGDVPSYERCAVCSAACSARVEEKSGKPINLDLEIEIEDTRLEFCDEVDGITVEIIAKRFYELGRNAK